MLIFGSKNFNLFKSHCQWARFSMLPARNLKLLGGSIMNNNVYGYAADEAVKVIMRNNNVSDRAAKASIMKQSLIHSYDDVRFWSGISLPELPEEEFSIEDFEDEIDHLHFGWQDLQDLQDLPDSELSDLERSDLKKYSDLCKRIETSQDATAKWFEDFISSLSVDQLVEIFDNMDARFNTWATPPRAMIREMNV